MQRNMSGRSDYHLKPTRRKLIRACLFAGLGLSLLAVLGAVSWPGLGLGEGPGSPAWGDNFALWTTSSSFLTSLATASSSPPASFVPPTLGFNQLGLTMTGPAQDYQTTGVQSLNTLSPPFTVTISVTATQGTANPIAIFLASADLTQFLTVTANVTPTYEGMWATAPNISELWQLGEQFEPTITPAFNTLYQIIITVNSRYSSPLVPPSSDAQAAAIVTVKNGQGTVLGTVLNLQPGTGPFYLVLGQRIGDGPTGTQAASWKSVYESSESAETSLIHITR